MDTRAQHLQEESYLKFHRLSKHIENTVQLSYLITNFS